MKRLLFIFAILVFLPIAHAGDFREGQQAYRNGNYKTALSIFEPLAEQGHAGAQDILGRMYQKGQGVKKNFKKAVELYRKSAVQRDVWAQLHLGEMYYYGRGGLKKDYIQAYMWASISLEYSYNGRHLKRVKTFLKKVGKKVTPEDIKQAESKAKQCVDSNYENCGE